MRKFYALLAGLIMCLAGTNRANARTVTPDVADFTFTIDAPNNNVAFVNTSVLGNEPGFRRAYWSFGDGTGLVTGPLEGTQHHYQVGGPYAVCLRIYRFSTNTNHSILTAQVCKTFIIEASCHADFQSPATTPTPLGRYFVALPQHNQNKKPVRVCWTFGDGRDTCIQYSTTYTGAYATYHVYPQPGNYNVCVNILYDGGCQAQNCHPLQLGQPDSCRANFEIFPVSPTINPLYASFNALPWHNNNKKPVRICWSFGDGRDTCIQYADSYPGPYPVSHLYTHSGPYEVCVDILYQGGCQARKCETILIGRPDSCRADFERLTFTPANNPLTVVYKALPFHNNNKKPARICWNFGDGRDTCISYLNIYNGLYTVAHTYQHSGSYQVCVNILYYGGCEAYKCKPVQVENPDSCHADFERISTTPGVNPLLTYFRALPQHTNNRRPARICWTFGDSRDTCINYPENYTGLYAVSHLYNQPGQYEVCVNILYFGGCEARKCNPVIITRPDSCSANFERIPFTGGTNGLLTYFKALPRHNNNRKPARICWTFGDNRDTCINYPENYTGFYAVSHLYNQSGQYEVCVNILYFGGCESRKCNPVIIMNPDSCRADFENIPVAGGTNSLLTYFRALPWHNNNKKPDRICWTFGDGRDTCINYPENYTGQYVVSHLYHQSGSYEVCVKIHYFGGCESRKCKPVVIQPTVTTCSVTLFEITPSITSLVRGFMAVPVSTPPSRAERICWHFGDGRDTCIMIDPLQPLPNFTISHTYPGPGVYNACVSVSFQGGCTAYSCREVVIRGAANSCGGYMTDSLIGPRTFKFKGFSIHAPNDEVLSYRWTFGDGTSATGPEVTHTFGLGGNFQVCLIINTRLGCETRVCRTMPLPGNIQPVLQLSPNPVVSVMHVVFLSTQTEQVNIRILNSMGTPVRNYVRNVTIGSNTWNEDLSLLLPGLYSFVVQSPNQLASTIFLKQ